MSKVNVQIQRAPRQIEVMVSNKGNRPLDGYGEIKVTQRQDRRSKGPHMGSGQKTDIAKGSRYNAGPTSYSIPSVFDMNKYKSKGVGFKNGRTPFHDSYLTYTVNPGPGKYDYKEEAKLSQYTKLPEYSVPRNNQEAKIFETPAPWEYDQSIKFSNSKYAFKGATVFFP